MLTLFHISKSKKKKNKFKNLKRQQLNKTQKLKKIMRNHIILDGNKEIKVSWMNKKF